MKAGTTSLFRYLEMHPQISRSRLKEPSFFTKKGQLHGIDWYQQLFPENDNLKFEASTNYTKYPVYGGVPKRIHAILPGVKLIYATRHPVKRAISHLHHGIVSTRIPTDAPYQHIPFWKDSRGRRIINVSRYSMQIREYLEYFDRAQLHCLKFEDLTKKPEPVLNRILQFLGLDDTFYTDAITYGHYNKRSTRARVRFPKLYGILKAAAHHKIAPPIHRVLEIPIPRPVLPLETRRYIWEQVEEDMHQFESLFGEKLNYAAPA